MFPRSRGVPPVLYRVLAYLHGHGDDYGALSQDAAGSIAFSVNAGPARGAQMTARFVEGTVVVNAENPVFADEARRMTRVFAPIVDN